MTHPNEATLRQAYAAFGRGDLAGYLALWAGDITFRETVLDAVANETRGMVLTQHEFERKGRKHSYKTIHLYRFDHGKLTAFEEFPENLYAFDEAWAP